MGKDELAVRAGRGRKRKLRSGGKPPRGSRVNLEGSGWVGGWGGAGNHRLEGAQT